MHWILHLNEVCFELPPFPTPSLPSLPLLRLAAVMLCPKANWAHLSPRFANLVSTKNSLSGKAAYTYTAVENITHIASAPFKAFWSAIDPASMANFAFSGDIFSRRRFGMARTIESRLTASHRAT